MPAMAYSKRPDDHRSVHGRTAGPMKTAAALCPSAAAAAQLKEAEMQIRTVELTEQQDKASLILRCSSSSETNQDLARTPDVSCTSMIQASPLPCHHHAVQGGQTRMILSVPPGLKSLVRAHARPRSNP
jgi:hypothetical protein